MLTGRSAVISSSKTVPDTSLTSRTHPGTTIARCRGEGLQHPARHDGETCPHFGQRWRASAIVLDQLLVGVRVAPETDADTVHDSSKCGVGYHPGPEAAIDANRSERPLTAHCNVAQFGMFNQVRSNRLAALVSL